MKKFSLVLLLALLFTTGAYAQESATPELENFFQDIKTTVDLSYTSRYMTYGYDFGRDQGAFQTSMNLSYHGWYVELWTSLLDSDGLDNSTEFDYIIGHNQTLFSANWYQMDTTLSYIYFDYPKSDSKFGSDGWADGQELCLYASFPKIIPNVGNSTFTPFHSIRYEWDGIQSSKNFDDGWLFNFGITYEFPIPKFFSDQEEQTINVTADTFYNDGTFKSSSGFSHGMISISTNIKLFDFTISPMLSFQSSWEDSVYNKDVLFAKISISRTF